MTLVDPTDTDGLGSPGTGPIGNLCVWLPDNACNRREKMTTFDEREKGFEKKFAHDQDLKFKAESRRNKMIGEWAAGLMGMSGAAVEDYVKAVRKADLAEKGDGDVIRKIVKDLTDKGVKTTEAEVVKRMHEFLAKAVQDIEGAAKK